MGGLKHVRRSGCKNIAAARAGMEKQRKIIRTSADERLRKRRHSYNDNFLDLGMVACQSGTLTEGSGGIIAKYPCKTKLSPVFL